MSFDAKYPGISELEKGLNPFRTGQCLSTLEGIKIYDNMTVLIPFVQGSVFRQQWDEYTKNHISVLIPFVQGSVFRPNKAGEMQFVQVS